MICLPVGCFRSKSFYERAKQNGVLIGYWLMPLKRRKIRCRTQRCLQADHKKRFETSGRSVVSISLRRNTWDAKGSESPLQFSVPILRLATKTDQVLAEVGWAGQTGSETALFLAYNSSFSLPFRNLLSWSMKSRPVDYMLNRFLSNPPIVGSPKPRTRQAILSLSIQNELVSPTIVADLLQIPITELSRYLIPLIRSWTAN